MDLVAKNLFREVMQAQSALADAALALTDAETRVRAARSAFQAHLAARVATEGIPPGTGFDIDAFDFPIVPQESPRTAEAMRDVMKNGREQA